jgi:DNA sulfur modification protein DndB
MNDPIVLGGMLGFSAKRQVLLGFAPANLLYSLSFADVLDEETGRGYQRRFNPRHSLDFRKYIQGNTASTIPLTFNVRPRTDGAWRLKELSGSQGRLEISPDAGRVLSQVDCQHRLGHLNDLAVPLPFMCFIGLSEREETEVFSVINSKAKGLSTSLLDFHDSRLTADLAAVRPELFISLQLNSNSESPWHGQLDLGGHSTSGLARRASLRTMQKAVRSFLTQSKVLDHLPPEQVAQVVLDYWAALAVVVQEAWNNPRRHLINKGVGVYALMGIASDLVLEAGDGQCDKRYFTNKLAEFMPEIDWSTTGLLRGLGGEGGVKTALGLIRTERRKRQLRVVSNG